MDNIETDNTEENLGALFLGAVTEQQQHTNQISSHGR